LNQTDGQPGEHWEWGYGKLSADSRLLGHNMIAIGIGARIEWGLGLSALFIGSSGAYSDVQSMQTLTGGYSQTLSDWAKVSVARPPN
jgi:hypothetical protein